MLQNIEIDGFRSLIDFKLSFQKGLNVIVGANGTGKSNFVSFLDFLGTLIDSDLNSAIAVAQGAGSMFSKERFFGESPTELTFKLDGQLRTLPDNEPPLFALGRARKKLFGGKYSYHCTISYLASVPSVFISYEKLTVNTDGHDMTVSRTTSRDSEGFTSRVNILPVDHKINKTVFRYLRLQDQKIDAAEYLASRITPERSILFFLSQENPSFEYVVSDLVRYRSVNIDPSLARKPSPVGSAASLRSNGEGLAGALYQLKNNAYFPSRAYNRYGRRRRLTDGVFQSILSWSREVNPTISGIRVDLDVMEAQLRPYLQFQQGLAPNEFPFSRVSDGTVKWLALATVLFAEPELSVIEEPENFLHPFMQETFIALCRQALEHNPERTIVVSTHSPTLLDCCAPHELTLFELVDGKTRASPIANREELAKKVKESRFGLGYYYRIGALYGENSSDS